MKIRFFSGLVSIAMIMVLSGCNKAPQTEMDAAKTAIAQAQVAGADVYLPDEFNPLNDTLNVIILRIEAKKSKWFANYNDEKSQLNELVSQTEAVMTNTETKKNEIKNEVITAVGDVKNMLAENQELLTKAPKGKEGSAALMAIKDELSVLNTSLDEIMNMVGEGDLLNAQTKITAVNDKTQAINAELKEAIAKTKKR